MKQIEIPTFRERAGKRTKFYRFFEILPFALSLAAIVLLLVLSLVAPALAAIYILILVLMMFVRALAVAFRTVQGQNVLRRYAKIDWAEKLADLENPRRYAKISAEFGRAPRRFFAREHAQNIAKIVKNPRKFPHPSEVYHGVIVALYDESFDILRPTLQSILDGNYEAAHIFIVLAYEKRGGEKARETVREAKKVFGKKFGAFLAIEHPDDLADEVVGKGGNITFAGKKFAEFVRGAEICGQKIVPLDAKNVVITTLDCDNRPDRQYFSQLTYTWITEENRARASFQPICLFNNNIWDAPAPIRVIATGNSFWNVIASMRPHLLRNFASHSQGLWALEKMHFWSTRTVVEDGHQFWRSYFFFDGDYRVVPLHAVVNQDAVLSKGYAKTLKAQFIQLRRWSYGASDVPYVADEMRKMKHRTFDIYAKFGRLLEGHVSQACMAPIIAFGAFAPLYLNPSAAHDSIIVNNLPVVVSHVQQFAVVGLAITLVSSLYMLPPRPKNYRRSRNILMVLQWILMPVTSICYWSAAAFTAQFRLCFGLYMNKFDVTDKQLAKTKSAKK